MINRINHYALTSIPLVHDEEALTVLELLGRVSNSINLCIDQINENTETMGKELEKLPEYAADSVNDSIKDGTIHALINDELMHNLDMDVKALNQRIDSLLINGSSTENNSELIDARNAVNTVYATLGEHVRKLGTGEAFVDAVKPGTVREERIMPGMLGGGLKNITVPVTLGLAGHWGGGKGYYDADSLSFVEHSGYTVTLPQPCQYGDMFTLDSYIFGNKVYPAVLFNGSGKAIKLVGAPGKGNWNKNTHSVAVDHPSSTHIAFVCGNGYIDQFRARRVIHWRGFDALADTYGYVHMHAWKRTDTVTDRAQIKFWVPVEQGLSFTILPGEVENVKSWTFRVFAASNNTAYDVQLGQSASGYSFNPEDGIEINIPAPVAVDGVMATHTCVFVDFLPENPNKVMEASIILPAGAENPALHGHDPEVEYLNVVTPAAKESPLYKKKILGLGDSLMKGNTLKQDDSWFNLAAGAKDMVLFNAAANGMPIANVAGYDSILAGVGYDLDYHPNPDYVILQGGANDLRLNVSIDDFRTAIRQIIATIREKAPQAKILMVTNWERSGYINPAGYKESDYVTAMIEEAEAMNIPVVNNYQDGIKITDPIIAEWADEGAVAGGEPNLHFSKAANKYIATMILKRLEGI